MYGDKEVHVCIVGLHCFLVGGLIDIGGPCILYVNTVIFQDLSDSQYKAQIVVFFLASVKNGSGIAPAVSGV